MTGIGTYGLLPKGCSSVVEAIQRCSAVRPLPSHLVPQGFSSVGSQTTPFRKVFHSQHLREEFKDFLNHVFMQLDEKKFYVLIDDIMKNHALTDDEIYEQLYKRIDEARPNRLVWLFGVIKSLGVIKKVMGEQVEKMIGRGKKIEGLVEIGYPGRHVADFKKRFDIKGPVYAVNYEERMTDILQRGFIKPYDQHLPIGDYDAITGIGEKSVDLVSCFIGLHHVPKEKQDAFVQSIHKMLRDGGSFMLRDHDAGEDAIFSIATAVHGVFNAATGETLESDKGEIRDFQPMSYWKALLERNGFICLTKEGEGLVQKGDPSKNTLYRFVRAPETQEEELALVKNLARESSGYVHSEIDAISSVVEWHTVDVTNELNTFVQSVNTGEDSSTIVEFPFFKHFKLALRLAADSFAAARKRHSFSEVAFNSVSAVTLFLTAITAADVLMKGALALPAALLSSKKALREAETIEDLKTLSAKYSKFLDTNYFQEFHYFREVSPFWKTTSRAFKKDVEDKGVLRSLFAEKTWLNLYISSTMSIQLIMKGILCAPMNLAYGSVPTDPRIELIVEDTNDELLQLGDRVKVLNQQGNYKHISIPRYREATEIVKKLADLSIKPIEICGQKRAYLKVKVPQSFDASNYTKILEKRILKVDEEHKYITIETDVEKLGPTLKNLQNAGAELSYFHDY